MKLIGVLLFVCLLSCVFSLRTEEHQGMTPNHNFGYNIHLDHGCYNGYCWVPCATISWCYSSWNTSHGTKSRIPCTGDTYYSPGDKSCPYYVNNYNLDNCESSCAPV